MKKTTPAPKRAGTKKRERAEALARKALEALGNDPEALELVVRMVRVLAQRSRRRN